MEITHFSKRISVASFFAFIFGFILRLIDINRPYVGYHMWNEVYYTTIARNFEHFGLFKLYNYNWVGGYQLSQRFGPSPFLSWLIYIAFQIFGYDEWISRLPLFFSALISLIVMYYIVRELYNEKVGLVALFLTACAPGIVFISRQISLDSPMVTFGLLSFLSLLLAERRKNYKWLFLSSVFLGIAIFIKYTAVFFLPALAWLWIKIFKRSGFQDKKHWVFIVLYLIFAMMPAAVWMIYTTIISTIQATQDPFTGYIVRSNEWILYNWYLALQATWSRTAEQVGNIVWYPFVITMVVISATGKLLRFIRRHIEAILLIVPWFTQMIYPISWIQNDGYTYPAMYGLMILIAFLGVQGFSYFKQSQKLSYRATIVNVSLIVIIIIGSNLWDFRKNYHSWYSPLYTDSWSNQSPIFLINPYDPYYPAKFLRSINISNESILSDLPTTLYYAKEDDWEGQATWYWWGLGEMTILTEAIKSREYSYIVFTYQPPLEVFSAINDNGYQLIEPGVWKKANYNNDYFLR